MIDGSNQVDIRPNSGEIHRITWSGAQSESAEGMLGDRRGALAWSDETRSPGAVPPQQYTGPETDSQRCAGRR